MLKGKTLMHADCIFCDIAAKNHPSEILFENDRLFVIRDIMPKAPVHLLVIPKKHIASINDLSPEDGEWIGQILLTAKDMAKKLGIDEEGYKLVWNVGKHGGQVIPHIHLHVLGGKQLPE
jgi:histidine triad (HIT) family protein